MRVSYANVRQESWDLFSAEASEIGVPPGQWPQRLDVEPTFGNGMAMYLSARQYSDGEVIAAEYEQEFGALRLRVYND